MNPLVSVVIPTYNREAEVLAAIASVLRQSYRPVEVIVADDCSTDGTRAAVLSAACDVPLHLESLPHNQGPSAARNAGIRKARGKYIAFLDSDDSWAPSKLQVQVDMLERAPQGEKLVSYARVWIRRRRETVVRPLRAIQPGEPMADYLFANGGYIAQSSIVLAASLARQVCYDESLRSHEDWDFCMRLHAQGASFQMVPEPMGVYADDEPSESRASAAKPMLTLAFLERWKQEISPRAFLALRAKTAPQMRGLATGRAFGFIVHAVLRRAIHPVYSLALFGRLMFPHLREIAYAVRGRLPGAARLPPDLPQQ
jgi:hypothetical protein